MNNTHKTWHRTFIPWLLFAISLTVTVWVWYVFQTNRTQTTYDQFESRVAHVKYAIESRMVAYEQVLRGGVSLFATLPSVERQHFHNYVNHLQISEYYPGIRALGFSQRLRAAEKQAYIAKVRAEGFPNYSIKPEGQRDEYLPLVYLEPLAEEFKRGLGFDALSEPTRRAAALKARDTGQATITNKLVLVIEKQGDTTPGVVMYFPVYQKLGPLETVAQRREALLGFITSGFRIKDLMQDIVGHHKLDINFEIYDGTQLSADSLLYQDTPTEGHYQAQLVQVVQLKIAGCTWTIRFSTLAEFDNNTHRHVPEVVLFGGLFVSLLLFGISWALAIAREMNSCLQAEICERQRIEDKLRHQEELLRLVIDSIPQYIFWKDINSVYLGCNRRFALLAGVGSPDKIVGKTDFDLPWKVEDSHAFRATDQRLIETNQPEYHIIETVQEAPLQQRWLDSSRIPLHEASGQVMGILVTFEDITERKQAEIELERSREAEKQANIELNQFKTTLDMTLDVVLMRDAETSNFIYANQGAVKKLGYTQEELLQMTPLALNPELTKALWRERMAPLVEGSQSSMTFETVSRHKDGTLIPVEVFIQYIQLPGQVNRFISIARDITERKQTEAALLQAKEAAEHARADAEIANRAKSTFLANMSHELRTPLNGVLGYTQILSRDKGLTAKQQEGIDIIQRSGEYLLTLITDILDLSKIEAGKVELCATDFHFSEFIQGIIDLFKMRAGQKGIAFNYEPLSRLPTGIRADEKRLRQILINLLSNAIKFTEMGGVTLKVGLVERGAMGKGLGEMGQGQQAISHYPSPITNDQLPVAKIRFQVEDTGTGIASDDLEKIFLPFQQVGESHSQAEGTGLGLAITKKLVEMMGGELHVESTLGQGSTFWMVLDLLEVSDLVKKSKKAEQPVIIGFEGLSRKILVVDDKWENRSVLVNLLMPLGFQLVEASDGQECLDKALQSHPDLIFTDLVMPVMDGFEATRQLRKRPEFKEVPIIATSASVFDLDQQESLDAGCNDFIGKPIRAEVLLEKLRIHLGLIWIYERESSADVVKENVAHSGPSGDLCKADDSAPVVGPSAEQAAVLFDLAMMGDIGGILEEIDRLEESDEQLVPFCDFVRQLAKSFDEEQICNLLEQYVQ
jgi:PAS domain S-box-containing protein